jgi:hypothetical protein
MRCEILSMLLYKFFLTILKFKMLIHCAPEPAQAGKILEPIWMALKLIGDLAMSVLSFVYDLINDFLCPEEPVSGTVCNTAKYPVVVVALIIRLVTELVSMCVYRIVLCNMEP